MSNVVHAFGQPQYPADFQLAPWTIEDFLNRPLPKKDPFIEGLLYRRDIVALAGRRRHGKTTVVGNLVVALARGNREFLGFSVPCARRCLAFLLEDDTTELQEKFGQIMKDLDCEGRLAILTREDFFELKIAINVTDPNFVRRLMEACQHHCPDLIVLDNAAILISGDINNPKTVHSPTQLAWELASTFNAAVIIACHPRKKGDLTSSLKIDPEGFFEEVMGSSHFVNTCGSLWGVERNLETNMTYFLGGAQRYNGTQSLMTLTKDDSGWLQVGSDVDENFALAVNTPQRLKAWQLIPKAAFHYSEAERAVVPAAMNSKSTFFNWWAQLQRLKLVWKDAKGLYKKANIKAPPQA
jgi:hypothetical protein